MMNHRRRHYIYPDLDTLAAAFVCDLNRFLKETGNDEQEVNIALSGGSTPKEVFRQLVHATRIGEWKHVHLYWGDERCVPPEDPESNYGNARSLLLEPMGFPEERVHRIRGEEDPEREAARYNDLLLERLPVENGFPVFDWIWLGMGEDGHTVSIFPDRIEVFRSDRACEVTENPVNGQKCVTLTGGVINAARRVAFLVAGESKSRVVNEIVMKEGRYLEYPAFYVFPESGNLEWYLDMGATNWM
jgi:6-phosphogluconolactonase